MRIDRQLEKEGIEIIRPVNTLTINVIAKTVADKLTLKFPALNLDSHSLFIKLSRINMVIAKMPSDLSCAKYFYKTRTIYFREDVNFENIDMCIIHECIHALQELRDENDNLVRLGLCNFTNARLPGMALNEAAVQLMSAYTLSTKLEQVKYFDITLPTYSPSYYALECTLLNQMAYLTGNYSLFSSTIECTNTFKEKFISLTSKDTYHMIERNFDKLIDLEEILNIEHSLLADMEDNPKKIEKSLNQIKQIRNQIQNLFLKTQNLILTSYFNKKFDSISTLVQIDDYRKKLYNFKDFIGFTEDYSFYNDYYIKAMSLLEIKHHKLENNESIPKELSLVPLNSNLLMTFFRKVKKLFVINSSYETKKQYHKNN